jgi:hypothetical protein
MTREGSSNEPANEPGQVNRGGVNRGRGEPGTGQACPGRIRIREQGTGQISGISPDLETGQLSTAMTFGSQGLSLVGRLCDM